MATTEGMTRSRKLWRMPWLEFAVAATTAIALTVGLAQSPAGAATIAEFPIPTVESHPLGITLGPDGALWFTEVDGPKIGRITTAGTITEFPLPTGSYEPGHITAGPDGALWFTEVFSNKIGRITTAGTITEFPVPTPGTPNDITLGPDGALWFTDGLGNQIRRITGSGTITGFLLPIPNSRPSRITLGPDGALWFTEPSADKIGRITTAGVITEFAIPKSDPRLHIIPYDIAAGPDGALWFTEAGTHKIGRITPDIGPIPINLTARQLLNVATFVGPTTPPTPQQQQQTFRTTDPILAGASYYDPAEACVGVPPAGVKLFVFTLEGQLVLGRNRDTGGVSSTQIGTSNYQALLATLEPGALPPGAYNLIFWVKDCTDTYTLVSEFSALGVLGP
ncbi:Virginiamycin B lyase [Candidatus Methylomirabilis lanthanidiphila]|uniref:Virginiamycin B lyase n=1 Tax=Candidatus Methylomirabilis lanthanidiphila TaxID=2211376 RepID=A0A564ZJT7_9BACT|nr:Virginiamycin B lyase [Candidatus Methylomirabilis lanthanidiphila]